MKHIIVTGSTKEEFDAKPNPFAIHCYICKRNLDDIGVYRVEEEDRGMICYSNLHLTAVRLIKQKDPKIFEGEKTMITFYLCHECSLLLEAIVEKSNSGEVLMD